MFRPMRRIAQQLPDAEARAILDRGQTGILSLIGDDGYPYGVPVNYVRIGDSIYIHCAAEGYKIDAVRSCAKASFCVVDADDVVQSEYATNFRSVIAFGQITVITEDDGEMTRALIDFADKYCPDMGHEANVRQVALELPGVALLRLDMEHLTAKDGGPMSRTRRGL